MNLGLGQLDSLNGLSVYGDSIASAAFQSDSPAYLATGDQIVGSLSGTLTGGSVIPADYATVVAFNDSSNTVTLGYSYHGAGSTFTWYVLGLNGDSLLLSSSDSKDTAAAINAGNAASVNLQVFDFNGDDLVDYAIGSDQSWSAFSGPFSVSAAASSFQAGNLTPWTAISDSAANVQASLDLIQQMVTAGDVGMITLTDAGSPTMSVTETQLNNDGGALAVIVSPVQLIITNTAAADAAWILQNDAAFVTAVAVTDSAADVAANIDALQTYAAKGQIQSITLTDGGIPTLTLSETQLFNDQSALTAIAGPYQLSLTATVAGDVGWIFANESKVTSVAVADGAAAVAANLDSLQSFAGKGEILSIGLTDAGTPTLSLSESQLATDAAVLKLISGSYDISVTGAAASDVAPLLNTNAKIASVAVLDSAADVLTYLDTLGAYAAHNRIASISLTDGGTPNLAITGAQSSADASALADISGDFTVTIQAASSSQTISGVAGHETTVTFSGNAAQYSITPAGDGVSLIVTGNGLSDQVGSATTLQFPDVTVIVASQTPPAPGAVSTAQVTELYGAVFGGTPDPAGLTFYRNYAEANPSTPFLQYAEWFLASPQYAGNPAHAYAQTVAGDEQFIADSYVNLLHRAASASEVAYYENNVIAPALSGLAAGTAAYAAADSQAHAQTLVYFSQSQEFLADVQITAASPPSAQHWLALA
jgi:hypothetical protein